MWLDSSRWSQLIPFLERISRETRPKIGSSHVRKSKTHILFVAALAALACCTLLEFRTQCRKIKEPIPENLTRLSHDKRHQKPPIFSQSGRFAWIAGEGGFV